MSVEHDLVEMMLAGQIEDRPDLDAAAMFFRSTRNCVRPAWRSSPFVAGAAKQDHVVGSDARCEVHTFVPLTQEAALHCTGARAHRGEIGARIRLAHADAEVAFAARRCAAGSVASARRCRRAGAAVRSGGRRSSGRRPARRPQAFPRAPRSARARCARGRHSALARSWRSSRCAPILRLNSASKPPHERPRCCGVRLAISFAKNARTSRRSASAGGECGGVVKLNACMVALSSRDAGPRSALLQQGHRRW